MTTRYAPLIKRKGTRIPHNQRASVQLSDYGSERIINARMTKIVWREEAHTSNDMSSATKKLKMKEAQEQATPEATEPDAQPPPEIEKGENH